MKMLLMCLLIAFSVTTMRAAMPALVANYGYLRDDEDSTLWNGDGYLQRPLDLLDWLKTSGRL